MGTARRILVVDDEPGARFGLRDFLESQGYEVTDVDTCARAQAAVETAPPDVVVLDYLLPDGNALDLLPKLKRAVADVPILILTAHGTIDMAVTAIKNGAENFLTKPIDLHLLLAFLRRLLDDQRVRQKQLAHEMTRAEAMNPFLGTSAVIRDLADQARRVATADTPVLIRGETGTGKGILARWLHEGSGRAEEPFVDVNCAGLKTEFLESDLFGHAKGAFTGAVHTKPGLLEIAHHGSLFLDEIGDMEPGIQANLLKTIEEGRFRRLGEVQDRRADLRLVAATHQDLASLIKAGRFRADLYYRISAVVLHVPALRERPEDIVPLAERLLDDLARDLGRGRRTLSAAAEKALRAYSWPGNVREMRNVLERAILLTDERQLEPADLRFDQPTSVDLLGGFDGLTLAEVEDRYIAHVLAAEGGRVERAARRLAVPRSTLYQRIKQRGIVRLGPPQPAAVAPHGDG